MQHHQLLLDYLLPYNPQEVREEKENIHPHLSIA
jgi:hypothetical protein